MTTIDLPTQAGRTGASPTRNGAWRTTPPPTPPPPAARRGPGPRPAVHRARWQSLTLDALAGLSLVVVVALWYSARNATHFATLGEAWTSLSRLTGLVASNLLLLQVLLMARIPWLEGAVGQDKAAARHRIIGFTSFVLMVTHIAAVTIGYAGAKPSRWWRTTYSMVADMPAMLLALIGTICLLLVVVTSIKAARRRLRYETWHLVHLYAYLGCFFALPHQLWTGQDFLSSPLATAYWWTLWGATALAVIVYRVALPLVRSLRHRLVVADVHSEHGITTVTMTGRRLDRMRVSAGQFFQWRFLDGPGWTRSHPYSLAAAPDGQTLQISVADVGDDTRRLATMPIGTAVMFEGPYGRLHSGVRTRRRVLLMAAGIGIAPIKALLETLAGAPGDITLVYRVSDPGTAALLSEVAHTARDRGVPMALLAGPRIHDRASWLPQSWHHVSDDEALTYLCPDVAGRDIYLCGGPAWMDAVERAALDAGVPRHRIHAERFTW